MRIEVPDLDPSRLREIMESGTFVRGTARNNCKHFDRSASELLEDAQVNGMFEVDNLHDDGGAQIEITMQYTELSYAQIEEQMKEWEIEDFEIGDCEVEVPKPEKSLPVAANLLPIGQVVKLPTDLGNGVDIDTDQLRRVDLCSIPEELDVYVVEDTGRLASISRVHDDIYAEMAYVEEWSYSQSKSAYLLVAARAIAAKILESKDYHICDAKYDEDEPRLPMATWTMMFPALIAPEDMIKQIRDCESALRKKTFEIMPD